MFNEIFGSSPQVKVIDYLLAHPFDTYTKQQISIGAGISRSTLNNFIGNLLESGFLIKNESKKYSINTKSNIVKMLDKLQYELAMKEFEKQADKFDENIKKYTDAEIENMFETNIPNIDLNEAENAIEENEKILVNKKEYEYLLDYYNNGYCPDFNKISKTMESIINNATSEIFEKMSDIVFDAEKNAYNQINDVIKK